MEAKKRQRRLWKPPSDEEDGVLSAGYARIEKTMVADSPRSQRSVGPFGKRQSHWLLAADTTEPLFPWFFGSAAHSDRSEWADASFVCTRITNAPESAEAVVNGAFQSDCASERQDTALVLWISTLSI